MIAVAMPGKIGDALYGLAVARALSEKYGEKVDFYTSAYCKPMEGLVRFQSFVNDFIVPKSYILKNMSCGVQPWQMPIPDNYSGVFQLGFQTTPNCSLPDFMAKSVGLDPGEVKLVMEVPKLPLPFLPYYCMGLRGSPDYTPLGYEILDKSPFPVLEIGGIGDRVTGDSIDITGLDMLETAAIIAGSKGYVGLMSAMLVIANHFEIPKVSPHDGIHWDMRHVVQSPLNYYPVKPTGQEVLEMLSKTIHEDDLIGLSEAQHVEAMKGVLGGGFRFEHPQRKWEYSMVLSALRGRGCKTVLEIGGGGSLFAPAAAWPDVGMEVTVVDPDTTFSVQEQSKRIGREIKVVGMHLENYISDEKFDAIVAISVIEHVADDVAFLKKMASFVKPGGLVVLTTDFHPDGKSKVDGHLRTYNEASINELVTSVDDLILLDGADYSYFKPFVNNYTFAVVFMTTRPEDHPTFGKPKGKKK